MVTVNVSHFLVATISCHWRIIRALSFSPHSYCQLWTLRRVLILTAWVSTLQARFGFRSFGQTNGLGDFFSRPTPGSESENRNGCHSFGWPGTTSPWVAGHFWGSPCLGLVLEGKRNWRPSFFVGSSPISGEHKLVLPLTSLVFGSSSLLNWQ